MTDIPGGRGLLSICLFLCRVSFSRIKPCVCRTVSCTPVRPSAVPGQQEKKDSAKGELCPSRAPPCPSRGARGYREVEGTGRRQSLPLERSPDKTLLWISSSSPVLGTEVRCSFALRAQWWALLRHTSDKYLWPVRDLDVFVVPKIKAALVNGNRQSAGDDNNNNNNNNNYRSNNKNNAIRSTESSNEWTLLFWTHWHRCSQSM